MRVTLWLIPILAVILCPRANAASVVNMDEVPHVFTIDDLGSQREVTLLPWRKVEISSTTARIITKDTVSEVLDPDGHYAIWPGNTFSLQSKGGISKDRF